MHGLYKDIHFLLWVIDQHKGNFITLVVIHPHVAVLFELRTQLRREQFDVTFALDEGIYRIVV